MLHGFFQFCKVFTSKHISYVTWTCVISCPFKNSMYKCPSLLVSLPLRTVRFTSARFSNFRFPLSNKNEPILRIVSSLLFPTSSSRKVDNISFLNCSLCSENVLLFIDDIFIAVGGHDSIIQILLCRE